MSNHLITRRDSILALGATAAGAFAWNAGIARASVDEAAQPRRRALRVAHLTDVHVEPELRAGEGMAACFHHVQKLSDKPELILTGGDHIMDSFGADDARTTLQWDLWHRVLKGECGVPVRSCIGNHDIWGWDKTNSQSTGNESNWGKRRATDMLHLDERYYAFTQNGWQFVVLDSTQPATTSGDSYCAYLDDAQYDWLERTLAATPAATPIVVLSHIPILSAAAMLFSATERGDFKAGGGLMHTDCAKLKNLFARHSNVKLCISGHLHLCDRVEYNGVTYICNGAVSGNWWKGRHRDCDEGYAVLDLFDDGSFDHEYIKYGWKAAV
jgi:3',5'-cyclic-AMP phosphodiesterase